MHVLWCAAADVVGDGVREFGQRERDVEVPAEGDLRHAAHQPARVPALRVQLYGRETACRIQIAKLTKRT